MAKSIKQLRAEYTQLLEAMNENLRAQIDAISRTPSYLGQGALYIVRQVGTNNYKIGHTTNYDQRRYQFDVRLPFEIEETFVYRTDNYRALEQRVHELLKPHRLNRSEFFELTEKQVEDLVELIQSEDAKILEEAKQAEPEEQASSTREEADSQLLEAVLLHLAEAEMPISQVSTSYIQRKFSVGYSRAARINDALRAQSPETKRK